MSQRPLLKCLLIAAMIVSGCTQRVQAQPVPSPLSIVSPPNDSFAAPGQTIQVKVTRAQNSDIEAVAVHAFDWTEPLQGSDPLTFSLTIPPTAPPGPVQLIAVDMTPRLTRGVGGMSAPIILNVTSASVSSLRPTRSMLRFKYPGAQTWLTVVGLSASGTPISLQNSDKLACSSLNATIAEIDSARSVTSRSAGSTEINCIYSNVDGSQAQVRIPVLVAALIPGDLNGNGRVDLEDLAIVQGVLNTPSNGRNDARDLNHDGKIDALDARVLSTLCTYPRCATHK